MHIMLMAQCYAPENVSAAVIITELATDLAQRGHCVTMVTGAPNYPHGSVFKGYKNKLYYVEMLNGVRVVRVWSYISPSKKLGARLLHYGTYSLSAFYGGLFAGKPDILVSFSPPLPLGLSAWLLSRIWRIPWVLQIEDLYPEAAVAAGALSNKKIIAFFYAIEMFLYRTATCISVIAETFRRVLLAKNVPDTKLAVIPVWADPNEIRPLPKHNKFRIENNLTEKFIVLYAGNIGLTSCLEDVLGAAEILQKHSDVQFVIIGEGVKKESLISSAEERQLKNVLFLPFQPRARFSEILAAADLNLVTLSPSATLSSLPSKTISAMASGRPILAVANDRSEIAHIIRKAGCGQDIPPASPDRLAGVIIQLRTQEALRMEMGKKGRSFFEQYYSRAHCIDAYEKMLTSLI